MNHFHHRPYVPPHRPSPPMHRPPPPPPPPPPPEAFATEQDSAGRPRCYYCGRAIASEADVRKTEHQLGHGYTTLVMICPVCQGKKERGEGPFAWQISAQTVLGIVGVVLFAIFFLGFWLPGFLEMKEKHADFERGFEERRKKQKKDFDEEWNKRRQGF